MFYEKRELMCRNYNVARSFFIDNSNSLMKLEKHLTNIVNDTIVENYEELARD